MQNKTTYFYITNDQDNYLLVTKKQISKINVKETFGEVSHLITKNKETITSTLTTNSATVIGRLLQLTTKLIRKNKNNVKKSINIKNSDK